MTKVQIGSVEYTLKPFTKGNLDAFVLAESEAQKILSSEKLQDKIFGYYKTILPFILEEDLSDINWNLVDGREIEEVIMSFVPPSFRIMASLTGF